MSINRSAVISDDGLYRYRLDRWWGDRARVAWIMLNPSTADADVDDPTIRRVMRFSRDWGYDGCTVVNLWPFRAASPDDLGRWLKACRVHNESSSEWQAHYRNQFEFIEPLKVTAPLIVAAWGAWPSTGGRTYLAGDRRSWFSWPLHVLGLTKDGHPRHPLYVRADTKPVEWGAA